MGERAPWIIAAALALIGWIALKIFDDIQAERDAVAYQVVYDEGSRKLTAKLENLSKKKAVRNVRFSLACKSQDGCFEAAPAGRGETEPKFGFTEQYSNIRSVFTLDLEDSREIGIGVTTLPPRAKIGFGGVSRGGEDVAIIGLHQEATADEGVQLHDLATVRGFFIKNYFAILSWALVIAVLLLLGIAKYIYRRRTGATQESSDESGRQDGPLRTADNQPRRKRQRPAVRRDSQ